MSGWFGTVVTTTASTYTLAESDNIVIANTVNNSITVNLPTAIGRSGRSFVLKKSASANTMTVTPSGSEQIDSAASLAVVTLNASYTVVSDGANWWII